MKTGEIGKKTFKVAYRFNKRNEPDKVMYIPSDVFDVMNIVQSQCDELYVYYIEHIDVSGTVTRAFFPNCNGQYKPDNEFIIDLLTYVKERYANNN